MTRPLPYPFPPENLRVGVGQGDYYKVGEADIARLKRFGGLNPSSRVLDIGCGLGRVAWPLARELGPDGSYDGFDAAEPYIEWCSNGLALDPQRVRFHWFDLYSSVYNPHGKLHGENLKFPWPDGTFTLAIAMSLFTHISAAATSNYLRETARTLEKGGKLYASFFVLDNESRAMMKELELFPHFTHETEHGLLADPDSPDAAIAFDAEWLYQVFVECGFAFEQYLPGTWRFHGAAHDATYQDLVVVRRE